jgi:Ca2+-binding EF-hand superfamily protein
MSFLQGQPVFAVALCISAALFAADAPPAAAAMNSASALANFRAIDTDRDAKLDRHELTVAAAKDFDRLDVDHDGYLTATELRRTRSKMLLLPFPGRFASAAAFATADTDRDDNIDKHEYEAAVVKAYLSCDSNHDGTIEVSDLRRCGR